MSTYDLKRLETAIQYIRRMTEGRNPVTNRPAPENEVLINTNVNRCLKFVQEILEDVHAAGGMVGKPPRKTAAPKPQVYETFPYEVLDRYRYIQDQQISYFLKQIEDLLPEDQEMKVKATMLTDWLRENEYLVRQKMENSEKEVSVPTQKGIDLGLYSEKAGMFPNEYYRVYYNENAQRFLVDNFRRILTEVGEIRARRKQEKKKAAPAAAAKNRPAGPGNIPGNDPGNGFSGFADIPVRGDRPASGDAVSPGGDRAAGSFESGSAAVSGGVTGSGSRSGRSGRKKAAAQAYGDPAFESLVASIPADAGSGYADDYPDPGSPDIADFMGDGWESVDEGLPW